MGEELERRYVTNQAIDLMARMAKAYALSGYFDDASGELQAFVKISAGRELGLLPFESMSGIAIISGKPVVGAGVLAGLVKAHPKYDYRVTTHTDEACAITFFEDGVELGTSTFTMEDAKRAGLAGKKVWQSYPKNMTFARAMSNGVAFYTPDVTNGRVYVENEIEEDERPKRRRENALSSEGVPPNPETVLDVDPEPEMDTAVKEPMKGTASATLDPETAALEDVPETVGQKTATENNLRASAAQKAARDSELEKVEAPHGHDALRERTAAEIAADNAAKKKPETTITSVTPGKDTTESVSTEKILTEQEQNVAKVRQLVVTDLKGEDRKECHDAMKYLSMWGEGAPLELWKAFGKKALEWKTLKPALAKAVKDELARVEKLQAAAPEEPPFGGEQAADDAHSAREAEVGEQERMIDVEPEPEAPWAGEDPS